MIRIFKPVVSTNRKILKQEYEKLYNSALIIDEDSNKIKDTIQSVIREMYEYRKSYERVDILPWWLVGILHFKETNFNFTVHLHNGDPLTERTVNTPKGRPINGTPPFSWFDSVNDAILIKKKYLVINKEWTILDCLYFLEAYNGFGYRLKFSIHSPYLWMYSNIISRTNVNRLNSIINSYNTSDLRLLKQPGCALILKALEADDVI